MREHIANAMFWVNVAMLIYFIGLNVAYTWLLVLGWREGNRYVRRRRFADLDDMRASELTTPMSILVPAYNEEPVIVESVRALLRAHYPLHEVLVVNDGSKDDTLRVLREAFALTEVSRVPRANLETSDVIAVYLCPDDERLVVIDKVNGGKADAINVALNYARYPLFCTIDSDTIIDDDAMLRLVRPFQDEPETVACGGVVRIANGSTIENGRVTHVRTPRKLLENIQIVEYLRAFLAGRAGWARMNALLVISGAFGVFRREIVIAAGGYDTTTVGEDAELVVRLHRYCCDHEIPYKIQFLADPVCWTQAPDSAKFLARQRDRWHRGLVELLWKHRGMLFRPRYRKTGMVAMPYHVVFEGLGPIVEVLGYGATIIALALGLVDHRIALAMLVLALTYGLILSFGALLIEDRAYRRYASWTCVGRMVAAAFFENFGYRQWSSFVRARAFITLARGHGWGEMTRVDFNAISRQLSLGRRVVRAAAGAGLAFAVVWGGAMGWETLRESRAVARMAAADSVLPPPGETWAATAATDPATTIRVGGLRLPARATRSAVQVATARGFEARFWPGVNVGSTTPGHAPGEVSVGYDTASRWFARMGTMGVRTVRVYTILQPGFYRALRDHNLAHPRRPLYLIQGVWIPEADFLEHQDLYRPEVTNGFRREIADAVGVVHGDITIPKKPGHAGGAYRADVSPWLLAWSPGVEWDPTATAASDRLNAGRPAYRGRYFTTRGAPTPTESWIASMLDHLAGLEAARGWSRPVTFTNWLTVDPLSHPEEPSEEEDMVSVDPMHVAATRAWPAGFFASYHAYPYYPDFLRWSREYAAFRRPDGQRDPYAGYLHALRAHHTDQAVMVTEFGVPSGLGVAHLGPKGRHQGDHSEAAAMRINAGMLDAIREQGYTGGLVFSWTDEWFKFTWNTMEYDHPADRRPMWRDTYTNEEHFGVLAQDASAMPVTRLDGVPDVWATSGNRRIQEASSGPVTAVDALTDEEHVTLRIQTDRPDAWRTQKLTLGFDVTPGGNGGLPGHPGVMPGADVAVEIGPGRTARVVRAAWIDPIPNQYGPQALKMLPGNPLALKEGSGVWLEPRLMLNKPYTVPVLGTYSPTETKNISRLPWGPGDPALPGGDTRNLIDAQGTTIEVRVPWRLLAMADPSSHQVLIPRPDGSFTTRTGGDIRVAIAAGGTLVETRGVAWENWNTVTPHERVRHGAGVLVGAFERSWRAGRHR